MTDQHASPAPPVSPSTMIPSDHQPLPPDANKPAEPPPSPPRQRPDLVGASESNAPVRLHELLRGTVDTTAEYLFEKESSSRRSPKAAIDAAETFLKRTGMQVPHLDRTSAELLVKHATEYQLNIDWYAKRIDNRRRTQRLFWVVVMAIALMGTGATVLITSELGAKSGSNVTQVGFILVSLLLALQFVASATDVKAQIGLFWEAEANLKELLYCFEEQCRKLDWTDPQKALEEFKLLLYDQLRLARAETRKEQTEFFKTIKSPSDGINAAVVLLDSVRGRSQAVVDAQRADLAPQAAKEQEMQQAINAARKTLRDADVALAGAKARMQAYQDRKAREPGSVTKEEEDAAAKDFRSAEIARAAAAASLEEILRFGAVGR